MSLSPAVRASCELLGVGQDADPRELKKAYHRLAFLYHPDHSSDARAQTEFRKITEAYELLTDPSRVKELNQQALKEKLHRRIIEGLEITFGSFFGYRVFNPNFAGQASELSHALLTGRQMAARTRAVVEDRVDHTGYDHWYPIEQDQSILDNPAFDALEVAYAGKLSTQDEAQLKGELEGRRLARLPWVAINNRGLLAFMEGDFRAAQKCYQELCERVPGNIIFMYRLGLCFVIDGFRHPRTTLLGGRKPDAIKIEKGLELFRHCLKIAGSRPVGRQKCLVIRKILADVLEKTGRAREARAIWREILVIKPRSAEAVFHTRGREGLKTLRRTARPRLALGPGSESSR